MATTVGTETDFQKMLTNLIYLEYDAIAAYDSTVDRLSDQSLAQQIRQFRDDHHQHLNVLKEIAAQAGAEIPEHGDMKQMLTTGKVAMASLAGDKAILKAMKTNEDDTVAAYDRARSHQDVISASRDFFDKAFSDEERHRQWMVEMSKEL